LIRARLAVRHGKRLREETGEFRLAAEDNHLVGVLAVLESLAAGLEISGLRAGIDGYPGRHSLRILLTRTLTLSLVDGDGTNLTAPHPLAHGGWEVPTTLWPVIRQYRDGLVALESAAITAVMRRVTQDWQLSRLAEHYGCSVVEAFELCEEGFRAARERLGALLRVKPDDELVEVALELVQQIHVGTI
jgi:hypothetical protein